MEALKKRINIPSKNIIIKHKNIKNKITYNLNQNSIFNGLNEILLRENRKPYYPKIVIRLFIYICIYLEEINSDCIHNVYKNNQKFYYSSKLN